MSTIIAFAAIPGIARAKRIDQTKMTRRPPAVAIRCLHRGSCFPTLMAIWGFMQLSH